MAAAELAAAVEAADASAERQSCRRDSHRLPVETRSQWGRMIRGNARGALFDLDLGNGNHIFTFVIWA